MCFWILQPSMEFFGGESRFKRLDRVTLLTIGSLFVPFLAVYVSHGLLRDDLSSLHYAAVTVEAATTAKDYNFSRVFLEDGWLAFGFVITVIALRKIISVAKISEKFFSAAMLAAYFEVLWMSSASVNLKLTYTSIKSWVLTRKGVGDLWERFNEFRDWVVSHTWIIGDFLGWIWDHAGALANFVIVPFSWLTICAVVFNTSLTIERHDDSSRAKAISVPQLANKSATPEDGRRLWAQYGRRYTRAAYGSTKELLDYAAQPVLGPFRNAWRNFKTLTPAGAIPMLIFCFAFMATASVELGVVQIARAALKPLALDTLTAAIEPYIMAVARTAYFLVAIPLVIAAVDRFLVTRSESSKQPDSTKALPISESIVVPDQENKRTGNAAERTSEKNQGS